MRKRLFILGILVVFILSGTPMNKIGAISHAETYSSLAEEQLNAVAMLNYITVLTQSINASKNSRLYMEHAYSALINNTYPNAVDNRTLNQLNTLLDIMESYRMIGVKRDRLKFIYEQSQAQSIRAAMPNALGLLSAVSSFRPSKIASSIIYMAVDSATSYYASSAESELQFIKENWALDDDEAETLHNSRKGTFSYLINIVGEYNLPGELTLTENAVDEYVKWKNNENIIGRIQFLESNQATYQSFGGYWLTLAESYFYNNEFTKCLAAIKTYEQMNIKIFRKDYEYARILLLGVSAASEVLEANDYISLASRYAQSIIDHTDHDDWALRYFAAQTYIDLFGKTDDSNYMQQAYQVTLDNVNYLIGEQRNMNATYLKPVEEFVAPKDSTNEEKRQINEYNAMLKEERKTALPPIYEPLMLNCNLLVALAHQMQLSQSERIKIDGILHMNGEATFLIKQIDQEYWFTVPPETRETTETEIEFGGTVIIFPAEHLTADAEIVVSVTEESSEEPLLLTDWFVEKVERVTEGDLSTFKVVYTSSEAKKHTWSPNAEIEIDIFSNKSTDLDSFHFKYETLGTKNEWYDWFKVWEGHKNNWFDYAKFWDNSVIFEPVK